MDSMQFVCDEWIHVEIEDYIIDHDDKIAKKSPIEHKRLSKLKNSNNKTIYNIPIE